MGFMLPAFFSSIGNFIVTHWAKIKTAAFLATLAVGVKGFMQAKEMMGRGQDIMANKTAAGGKLPVIYGTRRVGCQVVYIDVSDNDSRDLYIVYALAIGECDEILGTTIELDGSRLSDASRFKDGGYIGTDKISSGNGSLNTVSQNGTGIDAGAGQFGTSPTSKYRYVMNLHHGAATQTADPMLVASMPNWTSAHKLNGVAYIAASFGYDKEGMWQGVPQMTVQVRGKKIFDPRDSSQTFGTVSSYKYSDNPALCFLDLISNNTYGKGLTAAQLNMSTFTSAANVCDTEVDQPYFNGSAQPLTWSGNAGDNFITIGGTSATTTWWQNKVGELIDIYDANGNGVIDGKEITDIGRNNFYDENEELIVYINDTLGSTYSSQTGTSLVKVKRFHCNGYLKTDKNVMENARELLANMRGIFLYINGKYELSIEDTGSSTFSINDSHIISDSGISVDYGNKDKKANKVIVEFFNANKKYELDTATVLHDATPQYYSDDGDEILEVKAEFPFITDPYIAYNMAKTILTRSRNQTTMQFVGTPEMYKLNISDIVSLSYAGLGFSNKICRVEALELQPNGLVQVSLIEYFDVYTWEVPPQEPVEELSNLPSAYAVKAPTGLAFTDSNASSTDRPFISWNIPTDFPDAQYRINVVDSSSNQVLNKIVDVNNADLNFLPTGTNYVASITSLNTLGTESSPATLTFTVGDAPVGLGDVQANVITANEINVTNLAAISANLGSITAGDMNIGSGNFTVSSSGLMTATGATISGGITATSLNVTNATITGTLDASVITLNNEPLDNVLTYTETGGIGLLTLNEGAAIDGDFVVAGNFEATGTQPDLIVGKVTGISSDTVQADAILRSSTGSGGFRIQAGSGNTQVVGLVYDAVGGTTLSADGGASGTFKINADGALAVTFNSSQNATFTGEVTADALGLPSQTPSTTTNKLYNVGGSLYFNGSVVGGGGTGDITAVSAGTNLNGGGTSGAVTLNLDNTISITGTISSGRVTTSEDLRMTGNAYLRSDNIFSFLTIDGSAQVGKFKAVAAQTSYGNSASDGMFNALNGYAVGTGTGTTVIDASRNLTNIGGISATGTGITPFTFAGTSTALVHKIGSATQTSYASTIWETNDGLGQIWKTGSTYTAWGGADALNIFNSNGNISFHPSGTTSVLQLTSTAVNATKPIQISGTTVIDASRNLTNIGAITSTGAITLNGSLGTWSVDNQGAIMNFSRNTANYIKAGSSSGYLVFQTGGSTTALTVDSSQNSTFAGTISSGAITSTGFITGTRLRTGDGTDGYFYSDTAGRTAFSSGDFYIQNTVSNFYNYATNQYHGATTGTTHYYRSNVIIADNWSIPASGTITSTGIRTSTNQSRVKLGVWSDNTYGIGMQTGYTFGGINNNYAMTFQMNNDNARGFWWGDEAHTNAQGAMALTTNGLLTVASGIRVGYGESDTTTPSAGLAVNGAIQSNTSFILGSSATTLSQSGVQLKIQTTSGYCEIGPANTSYMHFETDRARFYFNTLITVDTGIVQSYDEDLILRRAQNSSHQLTVGTTGITATGNVTAYSDKRLKTNIQTLDSKKALQMRGVSFIKDGQEGSGVIAQEIEEIAPELVLTADDEMGTKSVAYGNLVGYLIETVKDQQKQIDELKQRLDNDSSN